MPASSTIKSTASLAPYNTLILISNTEDCVTPKEAAELLRISESTVRRRVRNGTLLAIGNPLRIPRSEITRAALEAIDPGCEWILGDSGSTSRQLSDGVTAIQLSLDLPDDEGRVAKPSQAVRPSCKDSIDDQDAQDERGVSFLGATFTRKEAVSYAITAGIVVFGIVVEIASIPLLSSVATVYRHVFGVSPRPFWMIMGMVIFSFYAHRFLVMQRKREQVKRYPVD